MKIKARLFVSLVGSILKYTAEALGNNESNDIELIHCKFLRKVLLVKNSTNLEGLCGEVGRYSLIITRQLIITYLIKLLKTHDPLLMNVYNTLLTDANNNITYNGMNWVNQIKPFLNNICMSNLWNNQSVVDIKYASIKQRILDIYKQTWYAKNNTSSRLSLYCLFKHDCIAEKYLSCINEK